MSDLPLGYHITFGTYGTRLHGDPRRTVIRAKNKPGDPVVGREDEWVRVERHLLNFDPVVLDDVKRKFIEASIPMICERGDWIFMNAAAQRDHVHALLSAHVDGKAVRRWLKRWLGEMLSSEYPEWVKSRTHVTTNVKPTWWAEGGSVKWVRDEAYLETVYEYIEAQRTTKTR